METTTALRRSAWGPLAGPHQTGDGRAQQLGLFRVALRHLLAGGSLDAFTDAYQVTGLIGDQAQAHGGGVGDDVDHAAIGQVDAARCRGRSLRPVRQAASQNRARSRT